MNEECRILSWFRRLRMASAHGGIPVLLHRPQRLRSFRLIKDVLTQPKTSLQDLCLTVG